MQLQKEAKQRYLTQHILSDQNNKNDAQDFLDYCWSTVGNADIDSWTFTDLENIVTSYLASKRTDQNNIHETSYAIYDGGDQVIESKPLEPEVKMMRPPSPVRQIYIEPPKTSKKQTFKVSTFDNPPSPVRNPPQTGQNKVKLAPEQKTSLDEIFKDAFKIPVKQIKPTNDFDFNNIWGQATEVKPMTKVGNQIKFDSILSINQQGYNSVKVNPKSKNIPVVPTFNIPSPAPKHEHKQKQKEKSFEKQKQKHEIVGREKQEMKPVGNKDIFDIDFSIGSDVKTQRKTSPQTGSKVTKKDIVSPVGYKQPEIPRSPKHSKVQPKASSPGSTNLQGSITPSLTQSRKKSKQSVRAVQQQWFDIVKCVKAKTRQLALKPNLEIVITGHQIVNRNVFMPDYVRYFVSTPAINSEVKRKYNHFVKLRTYLEKFYPGFRLPYLSKSAWFQETDPNNIAQQKFMITHFMNDLLMNREIRNCRIVEEFLTLKDYKGLKVKFEEYEKIGALHSIEELCLLQGEVNVGYSENHRVYIDKIPPTVSSMQGIFQKYKKLLEQLTQNHQALQRTFSELAQTTHAMSTLIKNFNSTVQIQQCKQIQSTLKLINKMFKQLDKHSKFDMDLIETELKPLFRYEKQNLGTIKQVLSMKLKFQESFNPNTKIQKKEFYVSPAMDQFKIKINDVSKSTTVLRYQHGYYSNQTVVEFKRMLTNLSDKLSNKFGQYCHDYHERATEYSTFWNSLRSAISLPVLQ